MEKQQINRIARFSDEEIVELYWHRDENAIRITNDIYGVLLYNIANNIVQDPRDCEECRNDTYWGVWNAIPPTRPQSFRAFIVRILRNIAIDKYNEKTRNGRIPSELTISMEECQDFISSNEEVDANLSAKELGKEISCFLRSRNANDQYIFMNRFYLAEPIETIACELNITASAVYKKLTKLKRDLKIYLERKGVLS